MLAWFPGLHSLHSHRRQQKRVVCRMGKRKVKDSVHEMGSGPGSQVWEENPSLPLCFSAAPGPGSAWRPLSFRYSVCGKKAEVTCAVIPSANIHSLMFYEATLLVIEALSNADSCLALRAESMCMLCSQVFQNGLFCCPVPSGDPREHVGSLDNVVPQPFRPQRLHKQCICLQGGQALFEGTHGVFIQVLAYFISCFVYGQILWNEYL